jgi:predicted nucleotidyltransferase
MKNNQRERAKSNEMYQAKRWKRKRKEGEKGRKIAKKIDEKLIFATFLTSEAPGGSTRVFFNVFLMETCDECKEGV